MVAPRDFRAVTTHLREVAHAAHEAQAAEAGGSPADNLRTLESQIDAVAKGDLSRVLGQSSDDVTLEIFVPPEFPFIRAARGAAAFRAALEHNFAAVADQRPAIRDVFAEGDRIVLFGRETGVIRETGGAYDLEFVERFTFTNGRLASVQVIAAHARPDGD